MQGGNGGGSLLEDPFYARKARGHTSLFPPNIHLITYIYSPLKTWCERTISKYFKGIDSGNNLSAFLDSVLNSIYISHISDLLVESYHSIIREGDSFLIETSQISFAIGNNARPIFKVWQIQILKL